MTTRIEMDGMQVEVVVNIRRFRSKAEFAPELDQRIVASIWSELAAGERTVTPAHLHELRCRAIDIFCERTRPCG